MSERQAARESNGMGCVGCAGRSEIETQNRPRATENGGAVQEEYTMAVPVYLANTEFELEGETAPKSYRIPRHRPVRIYCDGVYDLFHYGHARQLQQAKHLFPDVYLLVGVHGDENTLKYKGVTVMSAKERYESVKHCRYVDEVVEDSPWLITDDFVRRHEIDYVAHDELPYACDRENECDIYGKLKADNKFVPTKRTVNISTSCLITRIIKNYDMFINRQILRGVSRAELNVEAAQRWQVSKRERFMDFWRNRRRKTMQRQINNKNFKI